MISAFASPILVPAEGPEVVLRRVPLSGAEATEAYSEDWLQDLLYRHPGILPVGDIDDSFSQMVPVCREMATPAGPVDVMYMTPDGRPVIVEAKLWRNPEARRKVIGQILDYAKELSRWDFDTFDAAVRNARHSEDKGTHRGLLDVMGLSANSTEAARFHDSVTRSLLFRADTCRRLDCLVRSCTFGVEPLIERREGPLPPAVAVQLHVLRP